MAYADPHGNQRRRDALVAAGKCWICKDPKEPGSRSLCKTHLEYYLERGDARRRARGCKMYQCGECGGRGHNRRSCARRFA